MPLEENQEIIRRLYEEVWSKGNLATADELVDINYVNHSYVPLPEPGLEGFKQSIIKFRTSFPDVYIVIEDMICEGDKVVTRATAHGTHRGTYIGIPPTGKQATWTGINIWRIANGKIVERWGQPDHLSILHQLGASISGQVG